MKENDRRRLRRLTDIALTGFAAAAAVYVITLAVLGCFGIKPYIVMSGSMEPAVSTGSICFVDTRASFRKIREGNIIVFESAAGGLVTHRAVRVKADRIETRGDANSVSDGFVVSKDNFRGKMLFSVPYLGYMSYILRKKVGAIAGTAVILAVYMAKMPEKQAKR